MTNPLEVFPNEDLREHCSGEKCWCQPFWEREVLVHNSADQREFYEKNPN